MRISTIGMLVSATVVCAGPSSAAPPIRVMLLDGEQAGAYHAWQETTPYLKRMLVVVSNYDAPGYRWPDGVKASFEEYIRDGGGLVSVHAADNAFATWKEYNLMLGVGGWRGRNEKSGPHFYYENGKLVPDPAPGSAGSHGARLAFKVVNRVTDHPITSGLPKKWMHAGDELYANLRGPGENMTVLATALSDPANHGTGHDEPVLMVIAYGKGRIFHTVMGHDLAALNCVGFIATYQRGTEWAATGKVMQKVPCAFPSPDKICTRREYDPPEGWVSPGARPRPPAK